MYNVMLHGTAVEKLIFHGFIISVYYNPPECPLQRLLRSTTVSPEIFTHAVCNALLALNQNQLASIRQALFQ